MHLDLYRIEDMDELEAAGVPAMFWEREGDCILVEWVSRFPTLEQALLSEVGAILWRVELSPGASAELRDIAISSSLGLSLGP